MRRLLFGSLVALLFVAVTPAREPVAQQPTAVVDEATNEKIRQEGRERSGLKAIVHQLTDIYGPRLTGSPSLEQAGRWAIKTMEGWGLTNGRMEPWEWGHEGWTNERASGYILAPVKDKLEFEVIAWSPSTNGTLTADAVYLVPPVRPTEAQLSAYLASMAERVTNRIVLVGAWAELPVDFTPSPMRTPDDQARARFAPGDSVPPAGGRRGGGVGGGRGRGPAPAQGQLSAQQVDVRVGDFLRANRPALRIFDAARPHGQIAAYTVTGYDSSRTVPTVLMRNEDYGRLARILADGVRVTLEFAIVNRTFPEGRTAYNATAEIAGTDKADEVVMLGGHLDSWHAATGATDNAVGCAIAMEAVHILRAIGARPRRTIRVALWSGEEQGLLGSRAYVAQHFGTAESPKPEFAQLNAYWNVDGGTGRLRGASIFGPPAAAAALSAFLKPFEDMGMYGAIATRSRSGGGTDHGAFNAAGLPGINASQDEIEYGTHTHHTNLDTYERIVWDDVRNAAVITASVVYHLATREEMLPRFPPSEMPQAPGGRGAGPGQ